MPGFGLMVDTHFPAMIRPIMQQVLLTLFQQPEHAATTLRERVCNTLRRAIHSSALTAGQRLPSSRLLAADLQVSRVTAEAAYRQLEAEGYLQRRVGQGTFVAIRINKPLPVRKMAGQLRLSQRGEARRGDSAHRWLPRSAATLALCRRLPRPAGVPVETVATAHRSAAALARRSAVALWRSTGLPATA